MADQIQSQVTAQPAEQPDKGEKALQEVEKLKLEKAEEGKRKSLGSKIAMIITAFMLGGVGFFTWRMLKKSTEGIGESLDLMAGPAGGLLGGFSKGALITGIAGVLVGAFLTVYTIGDYFNRKKKEKKIEKKVEEEKKPVEQKMQEVGQQISSAEQSSAQKVEPPKLVS